MLDNIILQLEIKVYENPKKLNDCKLSNYKTLRENNLKFYAA